jgi:hypothetical protein
MRLGQQPRLLEAKDGNIWFGSMNRVYRYDGKTITDLRGKKLRNDRYC